LELVLLNIKLINIFKIKSPKTTDDRINASSIEVFPSDKQNKVKENKTNVKINIVLVRFRRKGFLS
tara:strand:+ start:692 stop:889 length:198 start_codon:yes stop_codon:yes gene_type:complete